MSSPFVSPYMPAGSTSGGADLVASRRESLASLNADDIVAETADDLEEFVFNFEDFDR